MRFKTKTGEITKVKCKDIVWQRIGNMEPIHEKDRLYPNETYEEFALSCLHLIDLQSKFSNGTFTKKNLAEPAWDRFKKSIKNRWSVFSSKHDFIRVVNLPDKGWVRVKIHEYTPPEHVQEIDTQQRDRVQSQVRGFNRRVRYDERLLGKAPVKYLPEK